MSIVYLIKDNKFYKLGFSEKDIKERIAQLQTGNPHKLKYIHYSQIKSPKHAYRLEQYLLRKYKEHSMIGEWISINEEQVNEIVFLMKCLSDETVYDKYMEYQATLKTLKPTSKHKKKTVDKLMSEYTKVEKDMMDFMMSMFEPKG